MWARVEKAAFLAYLHDKLDGTNEVTEELEDQVLLLFFHLIETVSLPARSNFLLVQPHARVGVKQFLWYRTSTTGLDSLLLLVLDVTVRRLELLDQGVHILLFIILVSGGHDLLLVLRFTGRAMVVGDIVVGNIVVGNIVVASITMTNFFGVVVVRAIKTAARDSSPKVIWRTCIKARVGRTVVVGHGGWWNQKEAELIRMGYNTSSVP